MRKESGMLIRIRDMQQTLTPVNKRIAEYVLKHPDAVLQMCIRELAIQSNASVAAVIRFCKEIGINGYRELIVGLSSALSMQAESAYEAFADIEIGASVDSVIRNISLFNRQAIHDTLQVLDENEVKRAIDAMNAAEHISLVGISASALVAMDAQMKFSQLGKMCFAYVGGVVRCGCVTLLKEKDVVLIISNSGETREIIETLNELRDTPATIIAITRRNASVLNEKADIRLHFSTPEVLVRPSALSGRIAMFNIIDILYAGMISLGQKTPATQ